MSEQFDVIIIGGGPGGYVAAIKAAQLGLKVACAEKRSRLGGTCLNVGCIPSKNLLHASELYEYANRHFANIGISCTTQLQLGKMMASKDLCLGELAGGIEMLFKKNKITRLEGHATIKASNIVNIEGQDYTTKNIVIATGSQLATLPNIDFDGTQIISSDEAISLTKVPATMAVIGGGYIGLELGSVWRRLGSEVTVIEYADRIVPAMDTEIASQLQKVLAKQGLNFMLGTKVTAAERTDKHVNLSIEQVADGKKDTISAEVVLVSVGRRPYTENLGLENIGITTDKYGRIEVDHNYKTSAPGVYAIGDVIPGPMLAHKAEEEGVAVAEILAGQKGHVNYDVIPSVVYTSPEVASVGKTEQELQAEGIEYNVGKFPMLANSRAKAIGRTEGMVKMLACKHTDRLLGVHIIASEAGTMIAEAAVVMEFGGSSEDLARTCHAHPTLNEAVKEAALATFFKPLHM